MFQQCYCAKEVVVSKFCILLFPPAADLKCKILIETLEEDFEYYMY